MARPTDDRTMAAETGHTRAQWFAEIARSGASGRAAIGKLLQSKKVDPWWITVITVEYEAHAGIVEKDGRPKGYSLCITKAVAAPVSKVYQAFSAQFGRKKPVKKERPDKALVLDWDGTDVEALFTAKDGKTGIVVNHTRIQDRAEADEKRELWNARLARFKESLER